MHLPSEARVGRLLLHRLTGAALAALLLLCAGCGPDQTAIQRGDRLWADSSYDNALAEYRLAYARHHDDASLIRTAHAFARTDQLPKARDTYQVLLQRDPGAAAQAVYDYLKLAEEADSTGDAHGVASAVEAALQVRSDLDVSRWTPTLARYYGETGDAAKAEEYYTRALASALPDSAARYLYEIGRLYQAHGDCARAVQYLRPFQTGSYGGSAGEVGQDIAGAGVASQSDGSIRGEARWVLGSCAFDLARQAHQEGRLADALDRLRTVTELEVPQNLQDQAWFERGEIYFALGRQDDALVSYYRVLELNPGGTGQLVERARRRIDQLRFGT